MEFVEKERGAARLRNSIAAASAANGTPPPNELGSERGSQRSADDEDGVGLSPPFTQGVSDCLYHLRTVIEDIAPLIDFYQAQSLRDIAHDLAVEIELQIMMMFENWGVAENRRRELLRKEKIAKDPGERLRRQAQVDRPSGKNTKLQFDLGAELEASGDQQKSADQGPPCPQRATKVRTKQTTDYRSDVKQRDLRRALASTLAMVLHALGSKVQAQRGTLYLYDRTTSTLRSVCTVPDPSEKQIIIPSHTGAAGSVFTSAVAFNVSNVDEHMQSVCKVTDSLTGCVTKNLLAFPVVGGSSKQPLGVIEMNNKAGGTRKWNEQDEFMMYNTANLLHQLFLQYPSEVFSDLEPRAAQVIALSAINGSPTDDQLDLNAAALNAMGSDSTEQRNRVGQGVVTQNYRAQLVFRTETGAPGKMPDPSKMAGGGAPVVNSVNLKEVHSYLTNLEESYRSGLNQYVTVEKEKCRLQEDLQRKIQRIRVLDENVVYLDNQLRMARAREAGRSATEHIDGHESNYRNYQAAPGEFDGNKDTQTADEHGFTHSDQTTNRHTLNESLRNTVKDHSSQSNAASLNMSSVAFDFPGLSPTAYPNTVTLVQRLASSPPPSVPGASQAITTSVPSAGSGLPAVGTTQGSTRRVTRRIVSTSKALAQAKKDRLGGGFSEGSRSNPQSISAEKYRLHGGAGGARIAKR